MVSTMVTTVVTTMVSTMAQARVTFASAGAGAELAVLVGAGHIIRGRVLDRTKLLGADALRIEDLHVDWGGRDLIVLPHEGILLVLAQPGADFYYKVKCECCIPHDPADAAGDRRGDDRQGEMIEPMTPPRHPGRPLVTTGGPPCAFAGAGAPMESHPCAFAGAGASAPRGSCSPPPVVMAAFARDEDEDEPMFASEEDPASELEREVSGAAGGLVVAITSALHESRQDHPLASLDAATLVADMVGPIWTAELLVEDAMATGPPNYPRVQRSATKEDIAGGEDLLIWPRL